VTTQVISQEVVAKALFDTDVAGGMFDREFLTTEEVAQPDRRQPPRIVSQAVNRSYTY